jgi:hypothetical protein
MHHQVKYQKMVKQQTKMHVGILIMRMNGHDKQNGKDKTPATPNVMQSQKTD